MVLISGHSKLSEPKNKNIQMIGLEVCRRLEIYEYYYEFIFLLDLTKTKRKYTSVADCLTTP